jgi:RecB family exonuclease
MAGHRSIRLVRVPTLRAGHRALAALVGRLAAGEARDTAVLVPTAAAAVQLQRTIERLRFGPGPAPPSEIPSEIRPGRIADSAIADPAIRPGRISDTRVICWPDFVSRSGWYARLHGRLPGAPPLLDEFERETLMRASAREAIGAGATPPFTPRPGTVAEMLRFYDALTRLRRTVEDLERVLCGTLVHEADADRGAARLLAQTRFLAAAFRAFERRMTAVDGLDEHGVRALAIATPSARPYRHVVVTVGDIASDVAGLWPADFDLLARLPGLERIDVVVTEATLACGLYERLEERLPGIVDTPFAPFEPPPVLAVPEADGAPPYYVFRDREEELLAVARQVKWGLAGGEAPAARADDHAVIVQRPLPYVYLARHTLEAAGLPWTASDALPLAAEPYAAAVDLVCDCVLGECTRASLASLLRSPQFTFLDRADAVDPHEAARQLDAALERAGHFGGTDRLREILSSRIAEGEAAGASHDSRRLGKVSRIALEIVSSLAPLAVPAPMSEHATALTAFLDRYEARPSAVGAPSDERHLRARAAVRAALTRLREASLAHDDPVVPFRETMASLRRWVEAKTFEPRVGTSGVHVLDAVSARYADVDVARILGLVDGEWPERGPRDVFYPSALLADLGWPRDADRSLAARAAFADLLRLPRLQVSASTFTLEDDAIVQPAVLLDELEHCDLAIARLEAPPPVRVLVEEGLAFEPLAEPADAEAAAWVGLRAARPDARDPRFHGCVGAFSRTRHAVTQIDAYLDCPFRYFAEHVLRLEDEREDDPGLTPRERGELTHRVLQRFYEQWSTAGRGAVTDDNLDEARRLLASVAVEATATVPAADAAVERARLLGSSASPAMGDRVLRHELERDAEVIERRLEEVLDGTYVFTGADGRQRTVPIRGKADRIDLLDDGRFDIVDYKTGRAPDSRAVQLAAYAHVAEQRFRGHAGRQWSVRAADYVACRGRAVTHALGRNDSERDERLAKAQHDLVDAVEAIARGEFPPRPAELRLCTWCPYDRVCRKDYADDAGT